MPLKIMKCLSKSQGKVPTAIFTQPGFRLHMFSGTCFKIQNHDTLSYIVSHEIVVEIWRYNVASLLWLQFCVFNPFSFCAKTCSSRIQLYLVLDIISNETWGGSLLLALLSQHQATIIGFRYHPYIFKEKINMAKKTPTQLKFFGFLMLN